MSNLKNPVWYVNVFKSVYRTNLLTCRLWKEGVLIDYQLSLVVADGNTENKPDYDSSVKIESGFEYELMYSIKGVEKVYCSVFKGDIERITALLDDVNSKIYL